MICRQWIMMTTGEANLPTTKYFGEAIAVLAGDALLNFAFEIMLKHTLKNNTILNQR
jgi:geranylgeranyl pyrophosphate synthase